MLISNLYPVNLIGCGGEPQSIRNIFKRGHKGSWRVVMEGHRGLQRVLEEGCGGWLQRVLMSISNLHAINLIGCGREPQPITESDHRGLQRVVTEGHEESWKVVVEGCRELQRVTEGTFIRGVGEKIRVLC